MTYMRLWVLAIAFCAATQGATQDTEPVLTNSQLAEATQADAYFRTSNLVAALPIYEHLAKELPQRAVYAERMAFCLFSKADNLPPGEEQNATLERAKAESKRAEALGDKSELLLTMLDRVKANTRRADLPEKMKAAEAAFARGDLDGALAAYKDVAAADSKNYEARLFAGDMYFRKHDAKQAGEWFQKAIEVDPNRETAYRYWADTLYADGEKEEAKEKFIDAIVAEPYNRRPWAGLKQWVELNNAVLGGPDVPRPKGPGVTDPTAVKTGVTITVNPDTLKDPGVGGAWMMYQMSRAQWRMEKFAKTYPEAKEYRHSLAEEAEALRAVMIVVKEQKIQDDRLDPSLRDLAQLYRDNLIEPFVLISADQGIAQDYGAYRESHRPELHAYIAKYLIHPNTEKK